jgi:hypothetical protein
MLMDSWMPWTITRNCVRAFFPTLALCIVWDLWRNLNHAAGARQAAVLIDTVALCVVIAFRLAPPFTPAWEQLKYLFRWSWIGLISLCVLLMPLLPYKWHTSALDRLLFVIAYVFYSDLSRVCKTSYEKVEGHVNFVYKAAAAAGWVISGIVSSVREMTEGTFPWRDALSLSVVLLVLGTIVAFWAWGHRGGHGSYIQELDLNR